MFKNKAIIQTIIILIVAIASGFGVYKYSDSSKSEIIITTGKSEISEIITEQINAGDQIHLNIAAKIVSAQLEDLARTLCREKKLINNNDKLSLGDFSRKLNSANIITNDEYRKIEQIRDEIRNPAAHSNQTNFSKAQIQDALNFVLTFDKKYQISKK